MSRGEEGGVNTPGPTPAMMAMGLDMVLRWDVREKSRVVGCMWFAEKAESVAFDIPRCFWLLFSHWFTNRPDDVCFCTRHAIFAML